MDALIEPEDAIRHGENRVILHVAVQVLAYQKRGRLPTGEVQRESLEKSLQFELRFRGSTGRAYRTAEGVDHDNCWVRLLELAHDRAENCAKIAAERTVASATRGG